MAKVKYAGQKIEIGDQEYIIPSLSVGQAEAFSEEIQSIADASAEAAKASNDGAFFKTGARRIPIVGEAMRRNYPEVTDDWIRDSVSLSAMRKIWLAVLGISAGDDTRGE